MLLGVGQLVCGLLCSWKQWDIVMQVDGGMSEFERGQLSEERYCLGELSVFAILRREQGR